jgi:gliding motility-associated protein GldM
MAAINAIDKQDAETLKSIWQRLTIQKYVMNHGEKYPWIFGQFDHAPIVAATAVMTSLRSDVLSVQTLATQLIDDRVKVNTFDFNKIEPLAFSATSYVNQGDSVGLKVMIAAYDSTEAMKIRYWEDDSSEYVKPHGSRDKSNMKTFNGNAGDQLNITGGVGDHTLYGEIAVKVKGTEKWKPWKFNYSVGAPNAAISAADLQVLYINWKNKLRVSASGYKPESIRVKGIGCSVSSRPDGKGFYIATVSNPRSKQARLIVEATTEDGSTAKLADETFRVFPLPKPIATFGGKASGNIKKINAQNYRNIKATLGDSPLDVPYKVTKFSFYTTKNGNPVTYNSKTDKLTTQMKAAIKKMPKGSTLTFSGIEVLNLKNQKKIKLDGGIILKLI